jgi:hypothetical protein
MRTFAQKPSPRQIARPSNLTGPGVTRSGLNRDIDRILHLERTIGNQAVLRLRARELARSATQVQRQTTDSDDTGQDTGMDSSASGQSDCRLKIYSDPGCPESSLIRTCPMNQCCPAPMKHFALARKDSTSSFKGSCSGEPLETRRNDPELPCNWFYKDGGTDFLFATKLDCPVPIV